MQADFEGAFDVSIFIGPCRLLLTALHGWRSSCSWGSECSSTQPDGNSGGLVTFLVKASRRQSLEMQMLGPQM